MKNNKNNIKTGEYYLGLDVGTNSVGWAVTDKDYNILNGYSSTIESIQKVHRILYVSYNLLLASLFFSSFCLFLGQLHPIQRIPIGSSETFRNGQHFLA